MNRRWERVPVGIEQVVFNQIGGHCQGNVQDVRVLGQLGIREIGRRASNMDEPILDERLTCSAPGICGNYPDVRIELSKILDPRKKHGIHKSGPRFRQSRRR